MKLSTLFIAVCVAGAVSAGGLGPSPRALADNDSVRANDRIEGSDHDAARDGVQKGKLVPLNTVIRRLEQQYPGRMLDASLHELVPGQPVYRVIWLLPNNRRLTIWVDAKTGRTVRTEGAG